MRICCYCSHPSRSRKQQGTRLDAKPNDRGQLAKSEPSSAEFRNKIHRREEIAPRVKTEADARVAAAQRRSGTAQRPPAAG